MDYDLRRLGPAVFENLVQALVLAEYPNAQIYGRGRDGGREAVIRGFEYTRPDQTVDRTTAVVQVKHVDVPHTEPARGWARFRMSARKETEKWTRVREDRAVASDRSLPAGDRDPSVGFLLFVTNAALSPVPGSGGLDTFYAESETWRSPTQLNQIDVWHYATICALLDRHEGIRRTYLAGTWPRDPIAYGDSLSPDLGRVARVLAANLASELNDDRHVTLAESGSEDDDQLRLSDVVIDVPGRMSTADDATTGGGFGAVLNWSDRTDGASTRQLIVVGGPGQGKTTLSRFLAQIFRHSLITAPDAPPPSARTADTCREIESAILLNALPRPALRRWPFRIVLSTFAKNPRPILDHITAAINRYSNEPLADGDLARWLTEWPAVIILDGMDETPLDRRSEIVEQITHFEEYAHQLGADVVIVVTTRPQGERTDLDARYASTLTLLPLSPEAAYAYAIKLLTVRHADAPRTIDERTERLREAMKSPETGRLFTTPLQVTILSILLGRRSRLPRSRFQLFAAYFDTLYVREENKPDALGAQLQRERVHIESVHRRVGLLLHARAEHGIRADAGLTDRELDGIVRSVLSDAGVRATLESRVAALLTVVFDRLVFLVSQREGEWGFEVQSLQEFMAAQCIVAGDLPVESTRALLTETATSNFWRNVWLLAAGGAFTISTNSRELVMGIVTSIDSRSSLLQLARPSTALARDMLADDVATHFPDHQRTIVTLALNLRTDASPEHVQLLAGVLGGLADDREVSDTIRAVVVQSIADSSSRLAPLLTLLANGHGWTRNFATDTLRSVAAGPSLAEHRDRNRSVLDRLAGLSASASHQSGLGEREQRALEALRLQAASTDAEAIERLATVLAHEELAEGLMTILSRLYVDGRISTIGYPQMLADAEAVRDRSVVVWPLVAPVVRITTKAGD